MLNGIDPIILFNFFELTPSLEKTLQKIPIISKVVDKVDLAPIPIYLSERISGMYIDSEDKSIDIETTTETLADGSDPQVDQKGLASTVRINLVASKNSVGVTLLAAMADLCLKKVTSKEYSIDYLHGAVTVFGGVLHSFQISQVADNDLYNISIELSRSGVKTKAKASVPEVEANSGVIPL